MFFLSQPSHLYRYLLFRVDVMIRERCPAKWWTQAYLHPLQVTQVLPQDLMTRSGLCQLIKPFTQVPSSSDSPRPIHLPLIETSLRISCPPAPTPQPTAVCTSVNVPCVHHHGHTLDHSLLELSSPQTLPHRDLWGLHIWDHFHSASLMGSRPLTNT